jgi:hypothetical protein
MKLFRGIKSSYNKTHKNKVNSNYYECWTDNIDLAKIYYVEVEVEDEIINLHGDRTLCFLNRSIETQGIKGNEFLLYTEHESYQQLKIEKIN